ncbi:MAG: PAS domain S-box protein [Acidobacteria bacterium]|nr:PAS domain S-box protein [Acidobacteriota bacterium]
MDRERQSVLIVADDADERALVRAALDSAGYRTLEASGAEEAYRLAARERPALVFSDVAPPRADGVALARRLRADPQLRHTPVVLASARFTDTASVVEGIEAGADEYVELPADPLRLVAVVSRLLERARAEAHYRDIVEHASDIIYTLDLAGRLTSLNPAGALFLGRTQEDAVGRPFAELLGLEAGDDWARRAVEELRRSGAREAQARVRRAGGEARWLEFAESLVCDRAGAPVGVRGVARDVTARVEAKEQLRREREQYARVVESASDMIFTTDMAGRYTSVNRAGELIAGYAREQLLTMTWREIVAPDQQPVVEEMIARKLAGREAVTFYEIEIVARDGRRVPLEVSSQLIHEDGEATGVQGIARDVTERRRAEAAALERAEQAAEGEKMRSLGQLSAGVAHNFNNALTAILGRAQLLLRSTTDERQRRSLEVIQTAAHDAAEIVRRVQTFARRGHEAEFTEVALSAVVSDCLQLTRTRWEADARARGVRYDVRFENGAGGDDAVSASPSEMREVFVNLIFNALDAMPEGGELTLRERREGDEVVVEVSDTGAGVPPALLERIFEPFFTTKGALGSGLGLAVSYGIVARHGGTISVESEPGRGTTFSVRLSCCETDGCDDTGGLAEDLPRRRVLVVDDEPPVRDVLAEMLTELGQDVTAVAGAREAFEALDSAAFDLLITDLSMPDTDGLTLAAAARRRAPGTRVALATGYGQSVPEDAVASGLLDAVLNKPLQLRDVERALRKLFADAR